MVTRIVPILVAVCCGLAAPAAAVHWPQQGGDAGRSGYQPVGDGAAPVRPLWSIPGEAVVAPLITAGALADQRVVYGTADGRVHLRDLSTGRLRGADGGTAIDDTLSSGVFGDAAKGRVAFAESSGNGGLGKLYVVHNADNRQPFFGGLDDVEVAVIDEATGAVLADTPVRATVDHRVGGPAALSPPDAAGVRSLLFLAQAPGGAVSLVRVPVDAAGRAGAADSVTVAGADPRAGATIAFLGAGRSEPYAAIGVGDGVRTFSLARFPQEGPRSAQEPGSYGTPAVAVATAGLAPGQPGSGAAAAPGLFVSASAGGVTRVHRLEHDGGALVVRASSPPLPGTPAPAVTVAQEVVAGQSVAGWVVAGTGAGLHVLDARSLQPTAQLGRAGYAASVAAGAGRLAFTSQDAGRPDVVDLGTGARLPDVSFPAGAAHEESRRATAQPAISRGIVVYATDGGVFAYRTRCGNAVAGTSGADRLQAGIPGDAIAGFGGADVLGGGDGDDCLDGGAGRDLLLGGAGDDTLRGGSGADRADGGDGDDVIDVRGEGRDRVRCGPGRDTVRADRRDRVLPDCERGRRPRSR